MPSSVFTRTTTVSFLIGCPTPRRGALSSLNERAKALTSVIFMHRVPCVYSIQYVMQPGFSWLQSFARDHIDCVAETFNVRFGNGNDTKRHRTKITEPRLACQFLRGHTAAVPAQIPISGQHG